MGARQKDVDRQRDKKKSQIVDNKGSNANVYKRNLKAKDNKKRCYTCGSSEHQKRDCPDRENQGSFQIWSQERVVFIVKASGT